MSSNPENPSNPNPHTCNFRPHQDQLDPIDWATYCPHLWALEQRYYSRVAVLFGPLTQLQRSHPPDTAATRPTTTTHMNPLNVLPPAPRFHYLPISAPTGLQPAAAAAAGPWGQMAAGRGSPGNLRGVHLLGEL